MSNTPPNDLIAVKTSELPNSMLDALRLRWSIRSFAEKPISREALVLMLEAARWAPSSTNAQPWRFWVAQKGEEMHAKILNLLWPGNQVWAAEAPVLGMAWAKSHFPGKDVENRHALFDLGASLQALMTQATALGIYGHLMGGFDADAFCQLLKNQEPFSPGVCFALGYPGAADRLPEPYFAREIAPRTRLPLEDLVLGLEG